MSDAPLPLAELHCHLEGTISPALAQRLAARHGADLSRFIDPSGNYVWTDFSSFISAYDAVAATMRDEQDCYDVLYTYYEGAARQGLIYGEVFISPDHARAVGLPYDALLRALSAAALDLETRLGVIVRFIVTAVRHLGPAHAIEMARLAESEPHPMVVGFGLAGDEAQYPTAAFAPAFEIAGGAGLGLTAHAGELMGPQSIWQALEHLGVSRLGHGVRAHEDPALVRYLKERQITLELCPGSNLALGLFDRPESHPFGDYFAEGLNVTLSTDDPPYFGTDIASEYKSAAKAHGFDRTALLQITRNSLNAAFCDDLTRAAALARLEV